MIVGTITSNQFLSGDWRKYKMKRLNRIRICKQCGKEIDNSKRRIQKRTKFCSVNCADDYKSDNQERRLNDKSI